MEFSKKSLIIIGVVVLVIIAAVVALVLFGGNGASIEPVSDEGEGVSEVVEPTKIDSSVEFTFSPASIEMAAKTEYTGKLYVQFIGEVSSNEIKFVEGNEEAYSQDNPFDTLVAGVVIEECPVTAPLAVGAVASKEYDITIIAVNVGTQTVTVSCGDFSADLTITVNEGAGGSTSGGSDGGSTSGGSTGGSTSGGYTGGDEGGGSTWVYDDSGITYIDIPTSGTIDPTASM